MPVPFSTARLRFRPQAEIKFCLTRAVLDRRGICLLELLLVMVKQPTLLPRPAPPQLIQHGMKYRPSICSDNRFLVSNYQ
jgi:hypothetical protein